MKLQTDVQIYRVAALLDILYFQADKDNEKKKAKQAERKLKLKEKKEQEKIEKQKEEVIPYKSDEVR